MYGSNSNKGQTCVTMTIYESSTGVGPYVRNMFCWDNWSAFTIFQQTPLTSTSAPTSTTSKLPTLIYRRASLETGSTNILYCYSATASAGVTSSAPTATSTTSQSNDDDPPKKADEPSKAWIAGAVVGPVVACSLIGALGFWIGRRRQRDTSGQSMIPISEVDGANHAAGFGPYDHDLKGNNRHYAVPSELGDRRAQSRVVEMESHELQRPHYREVPGSSPDESLR